MTSTSVVARPRSSALLGRRIGQFAVGTFAGLCAAFVPRLALMVGPAAKSAALTVEGFDGGCMLVAFAFSLLIGGVAMILEWEGARSPRDTFMAALGIPALLTGMFNTSNVSSEAVRLAQRLKSINDERAKQENIPVDDDAPQSSAAPTGAWFPEFGFVPTVFAQEQASLQTQQKASGVGVRYREPGYWVVLDTALTKGVAEQRVAELRSRYGALTIQRVDESYPVCPTGGSQPYSQAVSRAVELKRLSQGTLTPRLVRDG